MPDDRYNWLMDLYKPKSGVPAFLEIVDIAGATPPQLLAGGGCSRDDFLSHPILGRVRPASLFFCRMP